MVPAMQKIKRERANAFNKYSQVNAKATNKKKKTIYVPGIRY